MLSAVMLNVVFECCMVHDYYCADCCNTVMICVAYFSIVVLSFALPNVNMLSVITIDVVILSVVTLVISILSAAATLGIFMLTRLLSVTMLSVVKLTVATPRVTAPAYLVISAHASKKLTVESLVRLS